MKQKLFDHLKNPNDKVIVIDLDGTLCEGKQEEDPTPIKEMIDLVWEWYLGGGHIIIYTARQPRYYAITQAWLIKNNVPFHGIAMAMKPRADVYIDNRALNVEDVIGKPTKDYSIYGKS